jgi:hypothetical protein
LSLGTRKLHSEKFISEGEDVYFIAYMGSIFHGMRLISRSRTEVIAQAEYICSSNAYLGRGRILGQYAAPPAALTPPIKPVG